MMMLMMMMMSVKPKRGRKRLRIFARFGVSLNAGGGFRTFAQMHNRSRTFRFCRLGRRVDFRRAPRGTSSRASHAAGVSTMSFIYGNNENAMPRYAPVHRIRTRAPFPRASPPDETTRLVRTPRWRILVLNERPAGGCAAARARGDTPTRLATRTTARTRATRSTPKRGVARGVPTRPSSVRTREKAFS